MGKKLEKSYPTEYNLLIAQDLWLGRYQIFVRTLLKEFVKLNANMNTIIKNVKFEELNTKIATVFLNTQTLKMI